MTVEVSQNTIMDSLAPGVCLTVQQLYNSIGGQRNRITKSVGKLITRGYVERVEKGCYQLTSKGIEFKATGKAIKSGPYTPKTGVVRNSVKPTLKRKVWRALPALQKFTIPELIAIAADGTEKDAYGSIQRFLYVLCCAGYLREMPRRSPGTKLTSNGNKRYALVRHTGQSAPRSRGAKKLFDPNTKELHTW
jgi:predicted transcriptional regulator